MKHPQHNILQNLCNNLGRFRAKGKKGGKGVAYYTTKVYLSSQISCKTFNEQPQYIISKERLEG